MSLRLPRVGRGATDLPSFDSTAENCRPPLPNRFLPQVDHITLATIKPLLLFLQQYCFRQRRFDQQLLQVAMAFAPILFPAALAAGPEELRLAEETVATLVSNALHIFNPTLARNVPVVTPQALCEAAAEASQQQQQQHAMQPASAQLQHHRFHQRHQQQQPSSATCQHHHFQHPGHLPLITTTPAAAASSHHLPDPHEPASDPNFEPFMQDSTFLFALDSMVSDSVTSCLFSDSSDLDDFFFDASESMSTLSLTASLSSELQLTTSASGAAVSSLSDPLSPASSSACLSGTDGGASTTTTSGGGDSQASGDIPCHTTLLDPHEHQHTTAHRQHRRQTLGERLVEVVPRRQSGSPRSPRSPRRAGEDGGGDEGEHRQTKTRGASARSANSNNFILTANNHGQQHSMGDGDAVSTADAEGNVICIIKAQPTAYGSGKSATQQTVVPYKASAEDTAGFVGAAERALAAAAAALRGVDVKTSGVLEGQAARHSSSGSVGGAAQRVTEGGADHGHGQLPPPQLQHRPLQRPGAFPQRRMSMGGHTDHGQHPLQQQVMWPVAPQAAPVGAPPQRRQTMGGSGNGSGSPRGSSGGDLLAPRNSCPASYYRHHHQLLVQQQQHPHPHQHRTQPVPSPTAAPCLLLGTAGHLRVTLLPGSPSAPPSLHTEPLDSPAASAHLVPLQQLDRAALQREKEVLKRQLKDVAAAYRAASGAELTPALKEPLRCVYVRYHRIKGLMAGEGMGGGQQQHMVHATALVA